jgi:hypothetical protein
LPRAHTGSIHHLAVWCTQFLGSAAGDHHFPWFVTKERIFLLHEPAVIFVAR